MESLRDPEWPVRLCAAEALGRIGDKKAVLHLGKLLSDEEEAVRGYAVEALGRIGGKAVLPFISAT